MICCFFDLTHAKISKLRNESEQTCPVVTVFFIRNEIPFGKLHCLVCLMSQPPRDSLKIIRYQFQHLSDKGLCTSGPFRPERDVLSAIISMCPLTLNVFAIVIDLSLEKKFSSRCLMSTYLRQAGTKPRTHDYTIQ